MNDVQLSGLLVQPIAERIRDWHAQGKLTEDDLDRALTTTARAQVDHAIAADDWAPLADVEGLVQLASEQLGDDSLFVEWADEIFVRWAEEAWVRGLLRSARSLVDGPGFVVAHAGEMLVRGADWRYRGGRAAWSVHFGSLGSASPAIKSLMGALLARLAGAARHGLVDVRFEGVDGDDLHVFGELPPRDDEDGESRLHRAALVGAV
jgi:hypothetical protein